MDHSTLTADKEEGNQDDAPGPGGDAAGEGGGEGVMISEQVPALPKEDSSNLTQVQEKESGDKDSKEQSDDVHTLLKGDLHALTRLERSTLYEAGVKFQEEGQTGEALKCFLGSLTGLSEETSFKKLPQCLHGVADIYFERKEYEKAVYFIQAEKMYYETALIDITSMEKTTENNERHNSRENSDGHMDITDEEPGKETKPEDMNDLSPDAKKGREFENLSKLCLKEGKLQLALEYCGKATKMYRTVYGDDHPTTIAALDLFTVIYADVGKKLYSDAMEKFKEEGDSKPDDPAALDGAIPSETELRHRSKGQDLDSQNGTTLTSEPDAAANMELEPTSDDRDDWVMTILLMLIFFLVTVFIAILVSSIYCHGNTKSSYCAQTRGDINYWYMYLRHLYHDFMKKTIR